METIRRIVQVESDRKLELTLPETVKPGLVEVILVMQPLEATKMSSQTQLVMEGLEAIRPQGSKAENKGSDFLASITGLGASGETDISERDEEILRSEIDPIGGWSSKSNKLV